MLTKLKGFLSKSNAKLTALSLALATGLTLGAKALAVVDTDVAATTASVVDTMKENIVGVITANIVNIVIVGVIIFSFGFVWRLTRRFMR